MQYVSLTAKWHFPCPPFLEEKWKLSCSSFFAIPTHHEEGNFAALLIGTRNTWSVLLWAVLTSLSPAIFWNSQCAWPFVLIITRLPDCMCPSCCLTINLYIWTKTRVFLLRYYVIEDSSHLDSFFKFSLIWLFFIPFEFFRARLMW